MSDLPFPGSGRRGGAAAAPPGSGDLRIRSSLVGASVLLLLLLRDLSGWLEGLLFPGFSEAGAALYACLSYLLVMAVPLLALVFFSDRSSASPPPPRIRPSGSLLLLPPSLSWLLLLNGLVALIGRKVPLTVPAPLFSSDPAVFALQLLSRALLPALLEEFFFRGAVLRGLEPAGEGPAVLTGALIFMVCHGEPAQWIPAFGAGLWFGLVVLRAGSLRPVILAHFSYNLLAALSSRFPGPLFRAWLPAVFFALSPAVLPPLRRSRLLERKSPGPAAVSPSALFSVPLALAFLLALTGDLLPRLR